jgi:hypothetical protein
MPAKPQIDERRVGNQRIEEKINTILNVSRRPFSISEVRAISSLITTNPKVTAWCIDMAVSYDRRGDIQNPKFQQALRDIWREQWNQMRNAPGTPDRVYLAVDAYFYPRSGVESYLMRPDFAFVKDLCIAGATGVYSGPKGSGKTDIATSDLAKLARLKQDHIDNRGKSLLSTYARVGSVFWRPLDDISLIGSGPPNDGEEIDKEDQTTRTGEWKRPKKLDLFHAKDVRFPTNISIRNNSVLGNRVQFGGRVSDMALAGMKNDEDGCQSVTCLDEFGLAANKRRGMTTAAWVIEQFTQTNRKSWSSLMVIAQDAVRQLSSSLVENAQTHVEKPSITELDQAIITVSGLFYNQLFRHVPRSPVNFDTQSNASFFPDITLTVVWDYVSARQREVAESGGDWDHLMELKIAREFITTNRASEKDMAEGKSGILRSEIRVYLGKIDPTSGKLYTAERVARLLAEDLEQDWKKEVLPIVLAVQADVKKEKEERARLGRPPTSDEIKAAYERDKKLVTEHVPVTAENDDVIADEDGDEPEEVDGDEEET